MNWGLYIVRAENPEGIPIGSRGLLKVSSGPGIMDAPYGVMYVAPAEYVESKRRQLGVAPSDASKIARIILSYFYS